MSSIRRRFHSTSLRELGRTSSFATPYDWRPGNMVLRQAAWSNSIQPYMKNFQVYKCPTTPEYRIPGLSSAYAAPLKGWADMSYGMNGLLNAYSLAGVVTPASVILLSTNNGDQAVAGQASSFPTMVCDDPTQACTYKPANNGVCQTGNGGTEAWYVAAVPITATYWTHSKGDVYGYADGHVKWVRMGGDYRSDPYSGYDANGIPNGYWWDNCHALLFRPDYTP